MALFSMIRILPLAFLFPPILTGQDTTVPIRIDLKNRLGAMEIDRFGVGRLILRSDVGRTPVRNPCLETKVDPAVRAGVFRRYARSRAVSLRYSGSRRGRNPESGSQTPLVHSP